MRPFCARLAQGAIGARTAANSEFGSTPSLKAEANLRPVGGRSNLLQRRGAKVVVAPNGTDRK